jgi:hypothetical protein
VSATCTCIATARGYIGPTYTYILNWSGETSPYMYEKVVVTVNTDVCYMVYTVASGFCYLAKCCVAVG